MRKVIPLIAGALLVGTVGLLRDGGQAEAPRPRAASKKKRTIATAQKRSPAKARRRAKSRRR